MGPPTLGDGFATEENADVAAASQRVHALIGIARVDENFILLFVPGIHLVPIKSDISGDFRDALDGVLIAPNCVFRRPVPDGQRPIGRLSLDGSMGEVVGPLHEVHPDVFGREIVYGPVPCLAH